MKKLRVFISSTMDDLKEERMAIAHALKEHDLEPVYADGFDARSESPRDVCLENVGNSDFYVGVFKDRYGFIPPNEPLGRSVVELEYREAKQKSIPIFIFIDKNARNRESTLEDFLAEISDFNTGHYRKEYSTVKELVKCVLQSIDGERNRGYVLYREAIDAQRKTETKEIYKLPYFEKLKPRLK